jgi:hypothetical protein
MTLKGLKVYEYWILLREERTAFTGENNHGSFFIQSL